jgi:regulator of sirC expression with transglutaminase-like and TPR domain
MIGRLWIACCVLAVAFPLGAEEKAPAEAAELPIERLVETARKSVVVVTVAGRDGQQQGLGSGFIIRPDGLIATNLHVIGEARPIAIHMADGRKFEATSIHASDRALDLALVKIDADDLPSLELGDSDSLKDGQAVVAVGNPLGLRHSVVSGVVSGRREIEGRSMIQLAIPIEPGNSGGPLLDLQGRVHGVLTMKSLVTANLGFAVTINALKPLVEKPNPVPMSRWLTIGALDPEEWKVVFGGRWRQHRGHILAGGLGQGFGGRSLCLSTMEAPEPPYEVAVSVRLDDESGAAGLIFAADGGEKHYGFYPSGGRLRLTRFDGPDVYSWKILSNEASPHYHTGQFNTLKVRVEKDRLLCYVNDELAVESNDLQFAGTRVGLAKFRQTEAEFKQFKLGKELASTRVPPEVAEEIGKLVEEFTAADAPTAKLIDQLAPQAPASVAVIEQRARALEKQALALKRLARQVHQRRVLTELAEATAGDDFSLFGAGLVIARLDNEELDVPGYTRQLDRLAEELKKSVPADADEAARREALGRFLFEENGYHGSRGDYYNRSNSYLNEVLDDREGIPITLSVLYMELAGRLGLAMEGVGLPGHFVVRHLPQEGEPQLIDVYDEGKLLSREDAEKLVQGTSGRGLKEQDLAAAGKRQILVRMLHNLRNIAQDNSDTDAVLRYADAVLTISPEVIEDRSLRAVLRAQGGDRAGALVDIDWLLEKRPEGIDLDRVREFRELLQRDP